MQSRFYNDDDHDRDSINNNSKSSDNDMYSDGLLWIQEWMQ